MPHATGYFETNIIKGHLKECVEEAIYTFDKKYNYTKQPFVLKINKLTMYNSPSAWKDIVHTIDGEQYFVGLKIEYDTDIDDGRICIEGR